MEIKILGPGCANCARLEKYTRAVVNEMDVDATVTKVSNMREIIAYGVMTTPGLVIDGNVVVSGRVPSRAEVSSMIMTALAEAED
jgi:small redox-active disulfide protein 2